ncbi:MAG: hypothetical protein R2710_06955 [Acidimicrobiales bacterium]
MAFSLGAGACGGWHPPQHLPLRLPTEAAPATTQHRQPARRAAASS